MAAPDHRFHNTGEVVVKQNDVGGFLSNVRTTHTLQPTTTTATTTSNTGSNRTTTTAT